MKVTDTQLVLLSAASQRADHAIELPDNLKGRAAHKVVGKLLTEGLVEEVRSGGDLPVWRRDQGEGAFSLRITSSGLSTIQVGDSPEAKKVGAGRKKDGSRPRAKVNRKKHSASKSSRAKKNRKAAVTGVQALAKSSGPSRGEDFRAGLGAEQIGLA